MLPFDSWVKFTHLLPQDNDHLSDGARGDELEAQSQGLASDLDVGRGEHAQNVHDELLEHALVAGHLLQRQQLVEDDELDVVVALLDDEVDVGGGGGLDGGGRRGEGDQGAGGLVLDGGARGVEEGVDAADEAGTLRRVRVAHLPQTHKNIFHLIWFWHLPK